MNIEYILKVFNPVPCIDPNEAYKKYFYDCIEYLKNCPQKNINKEINIKLSLDHYKCVEDSFNKMKKGIEYVMTETEKSKYSIFTEEINDKDLLFWIIAWSKFFEDFLIESKVISDVSNAFEELFFFYTSDFRLSNGFLPAETDYVGNIIDCFYKNDQKKSFLKDNYADLFLEKRFLNPSNYVDYAWLIIFFNTKKQAHYGCPFNYKASRFLDKFVNNQSWLDIAYDIIMKKIIDNPKDETLLNFWNNAFELIDYHIIHKIKI